LKELINRREDLKGTLQKERNRERYFDDKGGDKRSTRVIIEALQKR
jgi:hypothetical protein